MRLPNKAIPYSKSVIARFPQILEIVSKKDITPKKLLDTINPDGKQDMADILSALDCLYALGRIKFNKKGDKLHYVKSRQV